MKMEKFLFKPALVLIIITILFGSLNVGAKTVFSSVPKFRMNHIHIGMMRQTRRRYILNLCLILQMYMTVTGLG